MPQHHKAKLRYIDHINSCQLCSDDFHCQTGEGLFDDVKKGYQNIQLALTGPRKTIPPTAREFLQKYGKGIIVSLLVCRKPIVQALETVLNLVTLGQFEKRKKEFGYDKLYHLFFLMKINVENQISSVRLEKNQVVEIYHSEDSGDDFQTVNLPQLIDVNSFISKGEKFQGANFWLYSASDNNCQVFVQSLLKGNHLYTPQLKEFVLQPTSELLTGFAKQFADATTDLAGSVDRAVRGDGRKKVKFTE